MGPASGNSATAVRGPAGAKTEGGALASLCRALLGPGNNGDGGEGTENRARGQQSDPRETETAVGSFSLAPKQRGRQGGNKTVQRGGDSEGRKPGERGKPRQREGRRVESSKGGNRRGCGSAPCGGGTPGVPALSAGAKRSWASSSRARGPQVRRGHCGGRSPAGLGCAAQAPAGGGKGACGARRRRRGTELTFLAHAGAGAARSWRARGRSGPRVPHIAPPARGRAGQGRAGRDCARRPARPGFTRVWRPALVPPLSPAPSQWRTVPSHAPAASPPRGAAGREGERGWGHWAPGLPGRGFPRDCLRGARSRPGTRRWRIEAEGPRAAQEDFLGKF